MNGIYETRMRIAESGPESSFEQVGEAGCHYRQYKVTSTDSAMSLCRQALSPYFANRRDAEEFLIVALDTKHRPLKIVRITRGTLDSSLVHPREVFRPAVHLAAAAILLVHNHPSDDPTPSAEDIQVTHTLEKAGTLMGIKVLDHIIVCEHAALSIREWQR